MTEDKKRNFISQMLNNLFPNPPIPLDHKDPYTLLIAVLLSAQCTDERVNIVTKDLFSKASCPKEMTELTIKEIEQCIQSLGLYKTKAKAIFSLSTILIEKYKGKVPNSLNALKQLPGVGHKTASVVMIQAFNTPAFPVDTHIHRLAKRWGLSCGKNVQKTEKDLKNFFPKETWSNLHLQMIYYGRQYCPARKHSIKQCPICHYCNSTNI